MTPFKKEIEYFLLMCQRLNMGQAAEEAGIQQAGMSKALKSLEQQWGKELFYRTNRGLIMTPFGEVVRQSLLRAHRIWDASLEHDVKELQELVGSFTLSTHPTIAMSLISTFFAELCESYPGIKINLEFKRSAEATKDVIEFKSQLAIVVNPIQHPDLIIHPISSEYVGCWQRTTKDHEKVLYYNPEMIDIVRSLKKFRAYKQVAVNDYEVIASLMNQSRGVALLPSPVALRQKNLSLVGKKLLNVKVCLIYRHDIYKTPAFNEIVRKIKERTLG